MCSAENVAMGDVHRIASPNTQKITGGLGSKENESESRDRGGTIQ